MTKRLLLLFVAVVNDHFTINIMFNNLFFSKSRLGLLAVISAVVAGECRQCRHDVVFIFVVVLVVTRAAWVSVIVWVSMGACYHSQQQ